MKKFKYIFRCDAGNIPEIGTGHLTRCLLIAKKLIEENLCEKDEICFATRKNKEFSAGFQKIKFSQFATINTEDICLVPNTKMEGNILL